MLFSLNLKTFYIMNIFDCKIVFILSLVLYSICTTLFIAFKLSEYSWIQTEIKVVQVNEPLLNLNDTEKLSDYEEENEISLDIELSRYVDYNNGKYPPEKFRDWVIYARENQCPTSLEFYQQIYEDLSPFYYLEDGKTVSRITREMIDTLRSNSNYMSTISMRDNWIWEVQTTFNNLVPSLAEIKHLLPKNIDFIVNIKDEDCILPADDGDLWQGYYGVKDTFERNECIRKTYNNDQKEFVQGTIAFNHGSFIQPATFLTFSRLLPAFSFGKRDCFKDIIYPVIIDLDLSYDKVKWEDKENRVVWRGRNTGTWIRSNNNLYKLSQRYRLANWAIKQKDCVKSTLGIEVDVGFSDMHQCDYKGLCDQVKNEYPILPGLSHKEQLKSKYLIVVDGNNWPFRIAHFLSSNSLVLYNGIFTFWFSRHLKPYVHYLPFKPDFSDLIDQLEYAKNHDEEMKQIVKNAREFAEKYLKPSTATCYWGLLAMEYGELVKHLF